MRLRGGLLLVVIASVLAATPARADAAALTLRDTGVTGSAFLGDGEHSIAVVTSAREVTVLDIRSGGRVVLPIPAGCTLADAHHGSLLWTCEQPLNICCGRFDTGIVQDIATGTRRALPRAPTRPNDTTVEAGHWVELGDRFARSTSAGYRSAGSLYTDLTTGRVRQATERRDTVVQLDGPQLTRRLCAGQLRPLIGDDTGSGLVPGPLATAGRWAVSSSYAARERSGRIRLQRCGQPARTLRRCPKASCADPVIDGSVVAWTAGQRSRPAVTLTVRSLRSGRVRRATVSADRGLEPLLIGGRLYVVRSTSAGTYPLAPPLRRLVRVLL